MEWLRVTVRAIDGDVAVTQDRFGKERHIPANILRSKGPRPEVGEEWFIDRALGRWLFAAIITGDGSSADTSDLITSFELADAIEDVEEDIEAIATLVAVLHTDNDSGESAEGTPAGWVWTQGTPSTEWDVFHPYSYNPSVVVVASWGDTIEGEVTYVGPYHLKITFGVPFSGSATLG